MNWPEALATCGCCLIFVGGMLGVLWIAQKASPPCPMLDDHDDWDDDEEMSLADDMDDDHDDADWWKRERNGAAEE
jgi:hypothetical protein